MERPAPGDAGIDPRAYLLDRFRADATTLRERMAALEAGAARPGPDAATSRAMAAACDEVVDLITGLPNGDPGGRREALHGLLPRLQELAQRHAGQPAVRAVYAGAITRIRDWDATAHG